MSSREAPTRYQEIIRGLLVQPRVRTAATVKLEPSEKPNAAFGVRHPSASGASLPDENRVIDAGSITLETSPHSRPGAFSPVEETVVEAGDHDRGTLRPARGILLAILLGVILWGLVIGGILIEAFR
jgi:hypothetical protein